MKPTQDTYTDHGAFPDEPTKDYTRGGRLLEAIQEELDATVEEIEAQLASEFGDEEPTLPFIRVPEPR